MNNLAGEISVPPYYIPNPPHFGAFSHSYTALRRPVVSSPMPSLPPTPSQCRPTTCWRERFRPRVSGRQASPRWWR